MINFKSNQINIQKIGSGNVGGKADKLINISNHLIDTFKSQFPEFSVKIPDMTIITTEFFEKFISENKLEKYRNSNYSNRFISHCFLESSFPVQLSGILREFLSNTHVPLAVRSSSFLENNPQNPYAGIYYTKMIPNNQPDLDTRFKALRDAIKLVYASTFFTQAKSYSISKKIDHGKEKMAIIIQHIAGSLKNKRFYPDISGVAQSISYYSFGNTGKKNGMVNLALGLGKTIVEGGNSWTYNPQHPQKPPPFDSMSDLIKNTQTHFWAVDMGKSHDFNPLNETEYLVHLQLSDAEYDNRIKHIASTYVKSSDNIIPGVGNKGPRIINFAPLLQCKTLPVNDLIKRILLFCKNYFSKEVEIEFAITFNSDKNKPHKFSLLQVQPMLTFDSLATKKSKKSKKKDILASSNHIMGNGTISNIKHIMYVKPKKFDFKFTNDIAKEIDKFNQEFLKLDTHYILVGFGRWGSSDPWLGIPVNWPQISNAKVILEVKYLKHPVDFSKGSHFFHNLYNSQIFYFYISQKSSYNIDWDWLKQQETFREGKFVRVVKSKDSLEINADGYRNSGVIYK